MDAKHKLEYVTDYLCGNREDDQPGNLDQFLRDNPDVADEAGQLMKVWHDLDLIDVAPPEAGLLDRMGRDIMERLHACELTDEELDWAAGGRSEPLPALNTITSDEQDES